MAEAHASHAPLPKEMRREAYATMYALEGEHWWFVGRRRIIRAIVDATMQAGGLGRDARLLDVGCGTGKNLEMLRTMARAEGVDVSDDALAFCKQRGLTDVQKGEIEGLPYRDGEFDLVTAFDVVEHLDDDVAGLREMRRVLKPGGRGVFFVPAFQFLWGVQDDVSHHRRRYTEPEFLRVVERAGFVVERSSYANATMFLPTFLGRALMKVTGFRPASENDVNVGALNKPLGALLGAERHWLTRSRLPFGVSIFCVARNPG